MLRELVTTQCYHLHSSRQAQRILGGTQRITALPTEPPQLDLLGAVASGEEAGMHVALSAEPPLLEQPATVTSFASVEGAEGHAALLAEPPQLDLPGAVANGEEDRPSIPPWLEWGSLIEFGQLPKPV